MNNEPENPLSYQVGGSHYKDLQYQPIEFFEDLHLDAFRANIIKYLARWRKKGGVEDLRKALHYAKVWSVNYNRLLQRTHLFTVQFEEPEREIMMYVLFGGPEPVAEKLNKLIQVCTDGQTHWEGEQEEQK